MELFVTEIGNSWKLFLTVVTQILDPSLKCIDKFTILAKIFQTDSFLCEIAHYGKSPISIFQKNFAGIDILILGARQSTTL